jgi:hypothetical protein
MASCAHKQLGNRMSFFVSAGCDSFLRAAWGVWLRLLRLASLSSAEYVFGRYKMRGHPQVRTPLSGSVALETATQSSVLLGMVLLPG